VAETAPARARTRLTGISSRAWEHPADKGALSALRQMKGFDLVLRKLAGLWNERAIRLVEVGTSIRVDERQFPKVHAAYLEAANTLDVTKRPELFVTADFRLNSWAVGIDDPIIVITSAMVDLLDDDDELRFVLGHELGHVESGHALYTTMLLKLVNLGSSLGWLSFGALGLRALIGALMEWSRKAELSGDRAGLLAVQDPAAALRVHMKLAGGGHLADLDTVAFKAQGEEYLNTKDVRDSVLKFLLVEQTTHPFAVVRSAELNRWVDSGAYTTIVRGDYPTRDDDADASVRAEVGEAAGHYKTAFEESQDPILSFLRDIGGGLAGARDKVWSWIRGSGDDDSDG
jgi:Zn-dependent protease with chaperone function